MRHKKKKLKYKNIAILLIVVLLPILIINLIPKRSDEEKVNPDIRENLVGKSEKELEKINNLKINKTYSYSKEYDKGIITKIDYKSNSVDVVISKGMISDSLYQDMKVNELGNVPIMMYHGIIDTEENKYTGGNVDKDGYNRTAKAFREDLEFYYNSGYRMIRLADYVNGIIDVELGYSPIILTFDDGNKNNFNVLGRNSDGSLKIDPNCAVGILEEFKKSHPDMNVTATFFVMLNIFNQKEYNEEILNWLVDHGYDVGNHTTTHANFTEISTTKTKEVVGKMYQKLDSLLKDKYVKIIALPFGSPYKKTHENYPYILKGEYNGFEYESEAALRVGWEPEVSPFNTNFDKTFLKRCRAYDNNGKDFDIEYVFKNLEKKRFISDGDKEIITIPESTKSKLNNTYTNVYIYK